MCTILKAGTSDLSCQICIHTVQWDPWLSVQEQLEQWAQKEHAAHPGKWGGICFLKFPFSLRAISGRCRRLLWGHIMSAVHGRKTAVLLPLFSSRYCSLREFYTYPQRCLYVSGKYSCRFKRKKNSTCPTNSNPFLHNLFNLPLMIISAINVPKQGQFLLDLHFLHFIL